MVYTIGITCPARVEFFRKLGATDFHFGLLGAIPLIMFLLQFVGALATNRIVHRRRAFIFLTVIQRTLYIPLVLLPLFFKDVNTGALLPFILILIALNSGIANFAIPLWFSWMGDLLPRRILSSYWGNRHRWMTLTWTVSYMGLAALFYLTDLPILISFAIVAIFGSIAGIVDILLFNWVDEVPNIIVKGRRFIDVFLDPIRRTNFRTFVIYNCAWYTATMCAAPFMQLYTLKILGLSVFQATLIWSVSGIGSFLVARTWGRIADRYGNRPLIVMCTAFKPLIVVVFFLVTPETAIYILPISFFFDSMINAGIAVATNGYMLKMSPQENRSMFIASTMAWAGIFGGLASIWGGTVLRLASDFSLTFLGRSLTNFHLVFALSIVLRTACFFFSFTIKEPESKEVGKVLYYFRGTWPMRMLRFPVGLYRRFSGVEEDKE